MKKAGQDGRQLSFDIPIEERPREPKVKELKRPIWTECKAQLIERYLYYFVLITKHGTYIDGFAGPQNQNDLEMWTARLVLESEPQWLRHFFLIDNNRDQVRLLRNLKKDLTLPAGRDVQVIRGDCNNVIPSLLEAERIAREAAFCLLDQRTFECAWSTVEALARYKKEGPKIEIFYFFMNAWLDRSIEAQRDKAIIRKWWGRNDWQHLRRRPALDRAEWMCRRFREELGYLSAKPWPIYERKSGGRVMYYMIHATDHPEAPMLMRRAYEHAAGPKETPEQMRFWLEEEKIS